MICEERRTLLCEVADVCSVSKTHGLAACVMLSPAAWIAETLCGAAYFCTVNL